MVYFIGAGPGDPELITLKGYKLLQEADTVIYAGSLVNPELLKYCRKDAAVYDSAHMSLPEITEVIRQTEPGITVRLQTGDTSLYSAINEQTAELERYGISYSTVPGVSSFCAAAAALNTEYTVPGRSQSVIISRIEGRTPVPERERIQDMASHKTSMVLFLSAGKTKEVEEALLAGGYSADTPAAIIYKASWPEEKKFFCTVGTLDQTAKDNGISRTSLLLIGDFLNGSEQKSLLYDPDFTTGYREGKQGKAGTYACAFTDRGYELGEKLGADSLTRISRSLGTCTLDEWVQEHFYTAKTLVFIGAVQIAVRAVSKYIRGKDSDPAVIVIDEAGQYIIPVLSGHIGGANAEAAKLAEITGGVSVITTASDIRGLWAADTWAVQHGLKVKDTENIVRVQSALLDAQKIRIGLGQMIKIADQDEVTGGFSDQIVFEDKYDKEQQVQIRISGYDTGKDGCVAAGSRRQVSDDTLILIPKCVSVGIGCKKGTPKEKIVEAFDKFLADNDIYRESVKDIASIDLKKDEEGLLEFAGEKGLTIQFYNAEELAKTQGDFTASDFVMKTTGVDNVCERAAVLQAGEGRLIACKTVYDGVTIAAAEGRMII